MKQNLTIFIYNAVESELPFLSQIKNKAKRDEHVRNTSCFADAFLFFRLPEGSLFIGPLAVSPHFSAYVKNITGRSVYTLSPSPKTLSICQNLIEDTDSMQTVLDAASQHNNRVTLYTYATTPEVFVLLKHLKKRGLKVSTPELPKQKNSEQILACGTKSGCRKLFGNYMPSGTICKSPEEAKQKAMQLYRAHGAVVIKTDKGNAGDGTHIIRSSMTPHLLDQLFKKEQYWKTDPIVVEQYIDTKHSSTPFPSIEGYIDPQGTVHLPYYCTMSVTPEGEFYGVEIHTSVVSSYVRKRMRKLTHMMGKVFSKIGYRGRFDVDFIFDGKTLYVGESNIRMNGGTDTYMLVRHLIGRSFFSSRFTISNFIPFAHKKHYSFEDIVKKLRPIAYNPNTKVGVIVASSSALTLHGLSYILIGRSKNHARSLNKRLLTILKNT